MNCPNCNYEMREHEQSPLQNLSDNTLKKLHILAAVPFGSFILGDFKKKMDGKHTPSCICPKCGLNLSITQQEMDHEQRQRKKSLLIGRIIMCLFLAILFALLVVFAMELAGNIQKIHKKAQPTNEFSISPQKISLKVGQKKKLNITSDSAVSYKSQKPKIATVSQQGVIQAKKAGKAKIIVTNAVGEEKTVIVTVKNNAKKSGTSKGGK